MKQSVTGSSNVAWFKLAEFVARGEKERTLSMYRLLAHSFDDRALAKQLEGDLLLTFKDEAGYQAYEEAAKLYSASNRSLQAAVLYEQLVDAFPAREHYFEHLIYHYTFLNNYDRIVQHLCRRALYAWQHNETLRARQYLERLPAMVKEHVLSEKSFHDMLYALHTVSVVEREAVNAIVMESIQMLMQAKASYRLPVLLDLIKQYDVALYDTVLGCVTDAGLASK